MNVRREIASAVGRVGQQIETVRDEMRRQTTFYTSMSEVELMTHNPQTLHAAVLHQLSIKVADRIMENLGPAIDRAIADAYAPQQKEDR